MDLSVIIPVCNEAPNIRPLYHELKAVLSGPGVLDHEIIYVDDGSRDDTEAQVLKLAEEDGRVRLISLTRRSGLSAALAAGWESAQGALVVSMDGDLQHDPKDIPRLLSELDKGCDLVCGHRRMPRYHDRVRDLFSGAANWAGRRLFGVTNRDFSTTFRAYRRSVVRDIFLFDGAHRFIPVLARMRGLKVAEVDIAYRVRRGGVSKVKIIPRLFKVIKDAVMLKVMSSGRPGRMVRPFKKISYEIRSIK
ncbi:MAG: glycosyltransferase family 2 protein [Candidatus Omnitrophica bacterium]|nr:glycosyltransferase family 2 protein [Candidatus Omnitrophota bacterium]